MTILFCHPEGFFCHPEGSLFCHPEGAERPKDPFERSENISLPPRGILGSLREGAGSRRLTEGVPGRKVS